VESAVQDAAAYITTHPADHGFCGIMSINNIGLLTSKM
jgi:hypothetical protein